MTCYDDLLALRAKYGTSTFDDAQRKLARSRLSVARPEKRKRVSKGLRKDIYINQGGKCSRCESPMSFSLMEIDHIQPLAHGGTNSRWNLRGLCRDCNRSKGSASLQDESKAGHGTYVDQLGSDI